MIFFHKKSMQYMGDYILKMEESEIIQQIVCDSMQEICKFLETLRQ